MKIEWLNDSLTEARVTRVTRGVLWWKRQAHVKATESAWAYAETGILCEGAFESDLLGHRRLCAALDRDKALELRCRRIKLEARLDKLMASQRAKHWQPVSSPPVAKVVRR